MRNTYLQMCDYGSRFRILKGGKISMVVSVFIAGATLLHAAPSGGVVTSGVASIAQSGVVTTVNQSSQKASINWQNFSIAGNETVNFNQPSASAITLNRVVGNEKSIINGALNANGQVWILNSNGVLFNSNAKVNTSGLLATTKALSDEEFQNGVYRFKGSSTASVINLGEITINNGGYASLLANAVSNEGTIKTIQGFVTLTGANEATINLNGNSLVSLKVDKGVLDALVENKGAILADGGKVYFTTNAIDELLRGVVNTTGIIEAKSLNDISSEVILFAHGGTANVSGTINATGGFVETSGKNLSIFDGTIVKAKTWLLDPAYVVIGDRIPNQYYADGLVETTISASTIVSSLNAGTNMLIESDDDIEVNENIITGAMANDAILTLKAGGDIVVYDNVTIDATQNSNTNKLNVWMSVANVTGSSRFYMNNGSSIKTNSGYFVVGGQVNGNGMPSVDGTAQNGYGASIGDDVTIDVGASDIIITAAGSGGAVSVDRATLIGTNINLKAFGQNDLELGGSNIEATQNLTILGANVYMEGRDIQDENGDTIGYAYTKLKAAEISITSNALADDADTMEIDDTVLTANSKVTINAAADVDLGGSQINFLNSGGVLEINSFTSSTRSAYVQAFMDDWEIDNEADLLVAINDDEGTNFASIDEYIANYKNTLPMLVNLKGGTYKSKLFSNGTVSTLNTSTLPILNNDLLAFGNGLQSSVNEFGMLNQPFYYDVTDGMWYKLTYSKYPLAAIIGINGDGTDEWNLNGSFVSTIKNSSEYVNGAFSNAVLNMTGLSNGSGTIIATNTVTIDGKTIEMTNTYTLPSDKALIAMDTKLKNTSGSSIDNLRLWVGAQDDWIGNSDETTKQRGNLVDGVFEEITGMTERAKALMITGATSGVLFRTTSEKSNVFSKENYGSDFYTQDPSQSPILINESDGAYGVFTRLTDLTSGQNESVRWYYGAGSLASLVDLAEVVSEQPDSSVTPPPPPPQVTETPKIIDAIVSGVAIQPPVMPTFVQPNIIFQAPRPQTFSFGGQPVQLMSTPLGDTPTQIISLGEIRQMQQESAGGTDGVRSPDIRIPLGQNSLIQLVNGGLNLPTGIEQEFFMAQR